MTCYEYCSRYSVCNYEISVKPVHAITSIKQSQALTGHIFLSCHRHFHLNCVCAEAVEA